MADIASRVDTEALVQLYEPDMKRITLGKERQSAVWRGETHDKPPVVLIAPLSAAQQRIPDPDFAAAFADITFMICGELRKACGIANSCSDGVPSVRGNYGTGQLLSCLGLEQRVFPDKMPWLKEHLTREQLARLTPGDIRVQGTFERGLEFMRRHRELFGDKLPLLCMDTQGPLDLLHLLLGDDIFYLFYDDPSLVRHGLDICLELGIRGHELMKEISGEAANECHHMQGFYSPTTGIRICEDTTAIVGPDIIEQFAVPYACRLAEHFGGAWVHYCGRSDALTEAVCAEPVLKGLNFGHIPGHEHDHVFEEDMHRCRDSGTVYFGAWPRRPGENGKAYLRRLHEWASQGVLIPLANPALQGEDAIPSIDQALDFWYSLD